MARSATCWDEPHDDRRSGKRDDRRHRGWQGAARGDADNSSRVARRRPVRTRQRQQPPQPSKPLRRRRAAAVGLTTILTDLLIVEEEELDAQTAELRFDIGLLAGRVGAATDWLEGHDSTQGLPIGLFGASTGAAAALVAAAERPGVVQAVVSRGGRPDLAVEVLARVRAPTLLIVGGEDEEVLRVNREALARLETEAELETVPGATHLFEEPGALEHVAELARACFAHHLGSSTSPTG
jgi:putative phosphoribosyl transferase